MTTRLVVLISGDGSNLQAIIDACKRKELSAIVVAVFSNTASAFGLRRADKAGIPSIHFPKRKDETRREYDARLAEQVERYDPQYVILAGWMRLLTSAFIEHFPSRIINLHPALPGTYPGTHAIERAYEAWRKGEIDRSGVMVHLVPDEGVDDGPVLATQEVIFRTNESFEDYEARVHTVEHDLLVTTIKNIILGEANI